MTSATKKINRLGEIDKLKGFAIFLVVLGHIVARENPANNDWYVELKSTIYLFHMPLFMFLSGLILAYARKPIDSLGAYLRYVNNKFYRLMPAYLLFSLVVFIGKLAMGSVMHVDNSVGSLLDYFDVLTNPLGSYCAYLWYIYVLFIFYAIAPLVYALTRNQIHLCLPVCLILHFMELPGLFALSSLGEYAFVFFLGCVAGEHYAAYSNWISRYGAAFVTPFLVVLCYATEWGIPKFAMGLLAIPACQALVSLKLADSWGFLKTLSYYTFPIYLMNTLFIGLTKGVLFKFATWDNFNFLWFAPVLLVAGTLGPIIAQELIIKRSRLLKQIVA
jgi:fucose 4-O-acetylase-like acetyltransferase